jgi:hypothetical protein
MIDLAIITATVARERVAAQFAGPTDYNPPWRASSRTERRPSSLPAREGTS